MRRWGLPLLGSAVALWAACRESARPESLEVSDTVERGPLKLTVTVAPREVWFGDPITLTLHLHAPEDVEVRFPPAEALGELTVAEMRIEDPRPGADGGLEWRQVIALQSFNAGELQIPPLAVKYVRRDAATTRPDRPAFEQELVSGSLKVIVRSALTTQDSVERPRDITATLLPAWRLSRRQLALLVGAIVVATVSILLLIRWLRRRAGRPVPEVPPELWALRALAELDATAWLRSGRAREYYYRMSEVLRAYIERKFRLAAPEMTTEEFLTTLARQRSSLPYDPSRLGEFLRACDLVKYAALQPGEPEAQSALETARAFIHATAAAATRAAAEHAAAPAERAA